MTHNPENLHLQPAGKIYLAESLWFNISATIIRERLQNGESCEDLLPEPVLLTLTNKACIADTCRYGGHDATVVNSSWRNASECRWSV
ncbi:hypothetical protein ACVXHA_00995 [Escherichia coli]